MFNVRIARAALLALTCTLGAGGASAAEPAATHLGSLTYRVTGAGPTTLVFIPGLGCDASVYREVTGDLASRYRIVTVTLDGFGTPAHGKASLDDDVAALSTLIVQQGGGHAVVVGHSLGGHLALRLAAERPQGIAKIVAVDAYPVFPPPGPGETASGRAAQVAMMGEMMRTMPADAFAAQARQSAAYLTAPEHVDAVAAMSVASDRGAFVDRMMQMMNADLRAELPKIAVPALVMAAAPDAASADAVRGQVGALYSGAATAKIEPIPGAHHFIMLDQRAAFERALTAFAPPA